MRRVAGLAAVLLLLAQVWAAPAQGQEGWREALDRAGFEMAKALNRNRLREGFTVGILRFQDGGAGVACEPLSGLVTPEFRRSLIHHIDDLGVGTAVSESVAPKDVQAVVAARWFADGDGMVGVEVKLGDVSDVRFVVLAMERVEFPLRSLPKKARECLLTFDPVEREVTITQPYVARQALSPLSPEVARFSEGKVWVLSRVTSAGFQRWSVVRLPRDEDLPVFLNEQYGFVYDLRLPAGPGDLAIAGPPDSSRLSVRVWTDRRVYRKGEYFTVFLRGDRDFHARIVYENVAGTLIQLLPNRVRRQTFFRAGKTHEIPDAQDRFALRVTPPFGRERIIVFARLAPLGGTPGQAIAHGLTRLHGSLAAVERGLRGVEVVYFDDPDAGFGGVVWEMETRP